VYSIRIFALEGQQQAHRLEPLGPSIDIIAEKEIGRVRRPPPLLEVPEKVGEVAVQIANYIDRGC
jgi:hypothetical protein